MPGVKQASKRKRVTKAVPALGAAGLTFSLVGGASAAVAPANNESQTTKYSPNHQLTLGEEEMADVSLATFHLSKACRLVGAFGRSRISFAVSPSGWRSSRKTFEGVAGGSKTW